MSGAHYHQVVVAAGLIEGVDARPGDALLERRFLITRRPQGTHLAEMWEFPGGKLERHERPEEALARELREELGVEVEVGEIFAVGHHQQLKRQRDIILLIYLCRIREGTPQAIEVAEMKWVDVPTLIDFDLPPADRPAQERLARMLAEEEGR